MIPSGWYFCAESRELKAGAVLGMELFGQRVVLWRTESGVAHMSASVCPHLGSDLAKLGRVQGEKLQCFSHKFTYDGEGDCVSTASKATPCRTKSVLRTFPIQESHGFILAWYDAHGAEPTWSIPPELFIENGTRAVVKSQYTFNVAVKTINEDNFDAGHLYSWHECNNVVSTKPVVDGPRISIKHDFRRHSVFFDKPLPGPLKIFSNEIVSCYTSTLYGHGLTYSQIAVYNFDFYLEDFIFITPISETKTLYTTFVRPIVPKSAAPSASMSTMDRARYSLKQFALNTLFFPITVRRLRHEHDNEGHQFWESQTHVESPIWTEQERTLLEPYRTWCEQFEKPPAAMEFSPRRLQLVAQA